MGSLYSLFNSIQDWAKRLVSKIKGPVIPPVTPPVIPPVTTGNSAKNSKQKPLPDLLKEYDLPPGLFPKNITGYEFNEKTKKITVRIPRVCESSGNSSALRFFTTVTGSLEKGRLSDIEGIKTEGLTWRKVTSIKIKESRRRKMINCTGNQVDRRFPFDEYKTPIDGITANVAF